MGKTHRKKKKRFRNRLLRRKMRRKIRRILSQGIPLQLSDTFLRAGESLCLGLSVGEEGIQVSLVVSKVSLSIKNPTLHEEDLSSE